MSKLILEASDKAFFDSLSSDQARSIANLTTRKGINMIQNHHLDLSLDKMLNSVARNGYNNPAKRTAPSAKRNELNKSVHLQTFKNIKKKGFKVFNQTKLQSFNRQEYEKIKEQRRI